MEDWVEIGRIEQIPRRGARCVTTPVGRIAVFRTAEDKLYAIEDRCPHKGGPLSQGIVHGAQVTCPLHNWVFSLETGEAQGADEGRVRTVPLKWRCWRRRSRARGSHPSSGATRHLLPDGEKNRAPTAAVGHSSPRRGEGGSRAARDG